MPSATDTKTVKVTNKTSSKKRPHPEPQVKSPAQILPDTVSSGGADNANADKDENSTADAGTADHSIGVHSDRVVQKGAGNIRKRQRKQPRSSSKGTKATGTVGPSTDTLSLRLEAASDVPPPAQGPMSWDDIFNTKCDTMLEPTIPESTSNMEGNRFDIEPDEFQIMQGIFREMEKQRRTGDGGNGLRGSISLDSVLSDCSYLQLMESMFGNWQGTGRSFMQEVPLVSKAYEESYMRECVHESEKPCVRGINCECQFIDTHVPFVGVQFKLPVPPVTSMPSSVDIYENKLCVLCLRKQTQEIFYNIMFNKVKFHGICQLYGNICDVPGEYSKQVMLCCPLSGPVHNLPLPICVHQRNRYHVIENAGVKALKQVRVGYECFRKPSS